MAPGATTQTESEGRGAYLEEEGKVLSEVVHDVLAEKLRVCDEVILE